MLSADLLDILDLLLKFLDVFLGVCPSPVGAVQSHLEFVDVLFQLLLTLESLGLGARLRLEACLHRLQRPLVIAPKHIIMLAIMMNNDIIINNVVSRVRISVRLQFQ